MPGEAGLDLPPGYRLIALREVGDAHAHAVAVAAEAGAGTLVWVRRPDVLELAVVLEPQEALATARRAFYAGMTALADALAAHCPPEKPLGFGWPDALLLDGGRAGAGRLAWPEGAPEGEPPAWLVFSAVVRLRTFRGPEPGHRLEVTTLEEEGFSELDAAPLAEGFARHLMVGLDAWAERGFAPVGERYLARLAPEPGKRRGLAVTGDLLIREEGQSEPQRLKLLDALAASEVVR